MNKVNRIKKNIPYNNQDEFFDAIFDVEDNLYNNPFAQVKFDQYSKNNYFQNNIDFSKKLENERNYENL